MTVDKIKEVLARIEGLRGDDERQHSLEDTLHQDVLQGIADGTITNPRECAAEALKSLQLDFARWCA